MDNFLHQHGHEWSNILLQVEDGSGEKNAFRELPLIHVNRGCTVFQSQKKDKKIFRIWSGV